MYVIVPLLVAGVGLIIVMAIPKTGKYPGAIYAMLFLVAMGLYPIICGSISWTGKQREHPNVHMDLCRAPAELRF